MNRLFVNIKVDREERPDIDQIYMAALSATGEQGGWPLTMFLTPDAQPFWGGTYFPKQPRYGRPGFLQVLQAIAPRLAREAGRDSRQRCGAEQPCRGAARRRCRTGGGSRANASPTLADGIQSMIDPVARRPARRPQIPQRAVHADTVAELACAPAEPTRRDAVLLSACATC